MKKVFLDTNVWLRFLLQDEKEQAEACLKLLELIEAGKFRPYTSAIVLLELQYVLTVVYKIPREEVVKDIEAILGTRGLVLIEKTDFRKALEAYRQTKIKLADCLIATALPAKTMLCSYDQDFRKVAGVTVKTPAEVVRMVQ